MESATVAANGFRYRVPSSTLLVVSDKPLHGQPKLEGAAREFYEASKRQHVEVAIAAVDQVRSKFPLGLPNADLRSSDEPLIGAEPRARSGGARVEYSVERCTGAGEPFDPGASEQTSAIVRRHRAATSHSLPEASSVDGRQWRPSVAGGPCSRVRWPLPARLLGGVGTRPAPASVGSAASRRARTPGRIARGDRGDVREPRRRRQAGGRGRGRGHRASPARRSAPPSPTIDGQLLARPSRARAYTADAADSTRCPRGCSSPTRTRPGSSSRSTRASASRSSSRSARTPGSAVTTLDKIPGTLFDGVRLGLIIAMTAIGLSLIYGTTQFTNFAHGEMVTFGALITWYLNQNVGLSRDVRSAVVAVRAVGASAGFVLDTGSVGAAPAPQDRTVLADGRVVRPVDRGSSRSSSSSTAAAPSPTASTPSRSAVHDRQPDRSAAGDRHHRPVDHRARGRGAVPPAGPVRQGDAGRCRQRPARRRRRGSTPTVS